jgi:hypothetical protein
MNGNAPGWIGLSLSWRDKKKIGPVFYRVRAGRASASSTSLGDGFTCDNLKCLWLMSVQLKYKSDTF